MRSSAAPPSGGSRASAGGGGHREDELQAVRLGRHALQERLLRVLPRQHALRQPARARAHDCRLATVAPRAVLLLMPVMVGLPEHCRARRSTPGYPSLDSGGRQAGACRQRREGRCAGHLYSQCLKVPCLASCRLRHCASSLVCTWASRDAADAGPCSHLLHWLLTSEEATTRPAEEPHWEQGHLTNLIKLCVSTFTSQVTCGPPKHTA